MVRLDEDDLHVELDRTAADRRVNVLEGLVAIDLRLARSEQIQVWPIQDEDSIAMPACHDRPTVTAALVVGPAAGCRPASTVAATCRTRSSGTSASIAQPSSVGRTQRSAPAACFLSSS